MRDNRNPYMPEKPLLTNAAVMALGLCSSIAAAQPLELFQGLPGFEDRVAQIVDPLTLRSRALEVDRRFLNSIEVAKTTRVRLNLFDDVAFEAELRRGETRARDRYSIQGSLVGEQGYVAMVVEGDVVVADIWGPGIGTYRFRYTPLGVHIIQEIDERQFGECGVGPQHAVPLAQRPAARDVARPGGGQDEAGPRGGGSTMDVLILYTAAARAAAGGKNAMNALSQLAVDQTNTAYANTGMSAVLRLIWSTEVSYNESFATHNTHLNRLTDPSDGFIDEAHTLRDDGDADLVSLIVADNDGGTACGVAWLMSTVGPEFESMAFSIVNLSCMTAPRWSFAHELGHNMGSLHDQQEGGSAAFSYSFGHQFVGNSGLTWRTIMARSGLSGTRIQNFSNPNVNFDGQPTGITIGLPNEADNRSTFDFTAPFISLFRLSDEEVWVDFAYVGLEIGSFNFPFNTLAEGVQEVVYGGTIRIKAGSTDAGITISVPVTLLADGGTVIIGN